MKKKRLFLLLAVFTITLQNAYSQSVIQGTGGSTSILLNPGTKENAEEKKDEGTKAADDGTYNYTNGFASFATKEKKLSFNYYHYFAKKRPSFIAITAGSELKNGSATIFNNGDLTSATTLDFSIGFRPFKQSNNWEFLFKRADEIEDNEERQKERQKILDSQNLKLRAASDAWFFVSGNLTGSKFKHFDPTIPFDDQVEKEVFTGGTLKAGFNYWNANIKESELIIGGSFGVKWANNFDDLTESTREDTRIISDSASGVTRKVAAKETVFQGSYKEFRAYPLDFDIYFVPHSWGNIGLLGFTRSVFSETLYPTHTAGIGLFFCKKQNVFDPIGGITFGYRDVFNVDSSDDDKGDLTKISVSIVTRLNLLGLMKKSGG